LNGHEAIVELLLKKTRNVDMQSNGGSTALSLAALNDEPAIIKLLLQNGADADIRQRYSDQTTLSLAASKATEQLSSSYSTQAR
jgi:ankyrin repeat protein